MGKKRDLARKIDADIVRILSHEQNPISTRDLAAKVKRAWHSVQTHCLKLQLAGKVNGFTISNLNVWVKVK